MPKPKSDNVFDNETQYLKQAKLVLAQADQSAESLRQEYEVLIAQYEKLLGDSSVITKISDRLQNRLNRANDKLEASSREIKRKNELLQDAIKELTKARVSKRATTIVFMAAIILFIISEVFLEPIVDAYFQDDVYINIAIKGSIALLLKPIDYLVEWYLLRDTMRKTRQTARAQR